MTIKSELLKQGDFKADTRVIDHDNKKLKLSSVLAKITDFSQSELMKKSLKELQQMRKKHDQSFSQVSQDKTLQEKTGGVIRRRGGGIAKRGFGIAK